MNREPPGREAEKEPLRKDRLRSINHRPEMSGKKRGEASLALTSPGDGYE